MNIKKIKYCIAAAAIVVATAFCGCGEKEEDFAALKSFEETEIPENAVETVKEERQNITPEHEKIRVYVCGAVRDPDVYELEDDSRVIDAVNAAGGFFDDAGDEYLNLALKLSDGQKIYVPTKREVEEALGSGEMVAAEVNITNNAPGITPAAEGEKPSDDNNGMSSGSNGKVNINQADKQTLMTLPGIGESKADRIIAYRQENGSFSCIEDIMLIGGIKEGLFNKVKDSICVD